MRIIIVPFDVVDYLKALIFDQDGMMGSKMYDIRSPPAWTVFVAPAL
jgi:hypothetical protein